MMATREHRVPIVGIGASAGGIEALEHFFRAIPPTIGAAFVVVTHLNPHRESVLAEVLQNYTPLPVTVIENGQVAEANHVYVQPENATLCMENGRFAMVRRDPPQREHAPIDLFLSSLALDLGERAVGVILSGADGDGTLGAKAIKEHGGLTLAQVADGTRPRYSGMPQAAIASGMIDFAVPVQDMPERIAAFLAGLDAEGEDAGSATPDLSLETMLQEIYSLLEGQVGHDFSGYKTKTFNRRIQRRKQVLQLATYSEYLARLRHDPGEVAALFRDLLINVTNFFRDPDAFAVVKESVIPAIFAQKRRDDTVRVWVPGCATGEEVYSLAILIREHLDTLDARPRVQIFATDIDERSLEAARLARYPEPLLECVSAERRERFFVRDGASYTVTKEVRELCVFSPHSLIRDPPFSRMDLVSCRNLLIYLAPNLQGHVVPLFHFSLRPQGFLFLGTAENIGQFSDLFAPVDKKQRIYKAREHTGGSLRLPSPLMRGGSSFVVDGGRHTARATSNQSFRQEVEAQVLERFAPAYVVINAESDVVLYSGRTGRYLEAAPGAPSRQLIAMARKGLRLELRSAVRDAVAERRRVERGGLAIDGNDGRQYNVGLIVEPLDVGTHEPLFIVVFVDQGPSKERLIEDTTNNASVVNAMERELNETRERLQSMIEEYETALEELKSSNEELVSVNEELQSSNEELEASKEELQSLNEELATVNAELGHKIDELDSANGDLRNLFDTSKIASVFVNADLSIRNFTPLAARIFHLLPSDRGRSIATFSSSLVHPTFMTELTQVLRTGQSIESRVAHSDGVTRYLVRIQRYDDGNGSKTGATVTFVDITDLDLP